MVGRTIAERYRLEEHLGTGGMGDVWRATDLEKEQTVALKLSRTGDPRQIAREARIGAGLTHPNVIEALGMITEGDEHWLVMEYLPARPLSEIIERDGPISAERAARIGAQLADALASMHAKGAVHRDVKPGNVLVTDDDTAKLSDFGIARWAEVTQTGGSDIAGTPGYLAPEVAEGREAQPASDVFALGATLFAAVEGTSPWGSPDAGSQEQLRRAKTYDITPVRRAGAFAAVLTQLMHRDPEKRPASENVSALLAGHKRPNRRLRRALIIGTAVAAVAALTAASLVIYPRITAYGRVGNPATMDVCGLASDTIYGRFDPHEVTTKDVDSYFFNSCSTWIAFSDNNKEAVQVIYEVMQYVPYGAPPPKGELGPVSRDDHETTNELCVNNVRLVDGNLVNVKVYHRAGGWRPLCEIADVAAQHVLDVMRKSDIPRRADSWPAGSLGGVDACSLLTAEDLRPQLRSPATPYPWNQLGSWACGWDFTPRSAIIEFSRQNPFGSDDGTVVDLGRDKLAYLDPAAGECVVKVQQRVAQLSPKKRIEVVRVILSENGVSDATPLCPGALALAKAVVSRLP